MSRHRRGKRIEREGPKAGPSLLRRLLRRPSNFFFVGTAFAISIGFFMLPLPSSASSMPSAVSVEPTPQIGALFTLNADGELGKHFCSGSVVDSPAGDIVSTAAHCVSSRTASDIVFVPAYDDGIAPDGIWSVLKIDVDAAWAAHHDPDDDVAFLVVGAPSTLQSIEQVTGAEQLSFGSPSKAVVEVIGYPDVKSSPISCRNLASSFSSTQLEFDCKGYTTGTSGSPLLADINSKTGSGVVIGVIGGYEQGGDTPSVSYAAKFEKNVAALFSVATGTTAT